MSTKTQKTAKSGSKKEVKKDEKKVTIGSYALDLLSDTTLKNKTYDQLASMTRDKFKSKTTGSCFAWYYKMYKNDADYRLVKRERTTKKETGKIDKKVKTSKKNIKKTKKTSSKKIVKKEELKQAA